MLFTRRVIVCTILFWPSWFELRLGFVTSFEGLPCLIYANLKISRNSYSLRRHNQPNFNFLMRKGYTLNTIILSALWLCLCCTVSTVMAENSPLNGGTPPPARLSLPLLRRMPVPTRKITCVADRDLSVLLPLPQAPVLIPTFGKWCPFLMP